MTGRASPAALLRSASRRPKRFDSLILCPLNQFRKRSVMYTFASDSDLDLDSVRARLAQMDDTALVRFGQAAAYMCSPRANLGKPPLASFVAQLQEARKEWRRRCATRSS